MVNMQAHTSYFPLVNLRTNYKPTNNQSNKKKIFQALFFNTYSLNVAFTIPGQIAGFNLYVIDLKSPPFSNVKSTYSN